VDRTTLPNGAVLIVGGAADVNLNPYYTSADLFR